MADGIFNIAKGAFVEKFRDSAANGIILLLETAAADATLVDFDDVAAMLAGAPVEAAFTNYARDTGITGSITVDDTNDRVDVDIPDYTINSAGNGANETLAKLVVAYEEAAADATRIPLSHHDFTATTDGSNLTMQFNAAGFGRAA